MMNQVVFSDLSTEGYSSLRKEDIKLCGKLMDLIMDILKTPYSGIGHPEQLKGEDGELWSRKISQKHRLVYRIEVDVLIIVSCYSHYGDK